MAAPLKLNTRLDKLAPQPPFRAQLSAAPLKLVQPPTAVRNGSVNEIAMFAASIGQPEQPDLVADVPRSGLIKDGAEDFLAALAGHVPVPEGARVFEVLESHAHKRRRRVIGKVRGPSRQRQPGSHALQFIEQAGVFRQSFRAWVVEQVLVLPLAQTPAHVMPIFDLRPQKPQRTSGDSASQVL